jgi:hypothetical protein
MVVVALGEPGVPVVWTSALAEKATAATTKASIPVSRMCNLAGIVRSSWFGFID